MLVLLATLHLSAATAQTAATRDSLAQTRISGAQGAALDAQLTRFSDYGFSGTVLVVKNRHIVLLKGYGLANVERHVTNTAATRFEMNSMGKMFTGISILQLAAAGKLALDEPLNRLLGAFPPDKQATITHLATHTAGLVVAGADLDTASRNAFVSSMKRMPRESAPGEKYRYTNAGYSLLAAVVEAASHETYEHYLTEHLFRPAGMTTARFRNTIQPNDPLYAHGYVGTPAELLPGPPNPYVWGTIGAGGVWTTVGDMYRWLVAVQDGVVVPASQRATLFAPPKPPSLEAFGWHVIPRTPTTRSRIEKGGASDDFASQMTWFPDDSLVVIWASNNLRLRWRRTLMQVIPAIVFDSAPPLLPSIVQLAEEDLARFAGTTLVGRDTLELRTGSGYLYALANRLEVPVNVLFFVEKLGSFVAFDPAARKITRLLFKDGKPGLVVVIRE